MGVGCRELNQSYQEPFLAIVVDPIRTVSSGKVCFGAFHTYPKGYKSANEEPSEYQMIPLNKIEDFGVHCKQYYSLEAELCTKVFSEKHSTVQMYWILYCGKAVLIKSI